MLVRRDKGWQGSGLVALGIALGWAVAGAGASEIQASASKPTFSRDVLPILQQHCQSCHRPGQIAPMALLDYEQTRPWAKAIRKAVAERTMPPFSAVAELGHFQDDPRLSDVQIETIVKWIEDGAPKGDPADAPAALTWNDSEWAMGEPDMVLEFREYVSKTFNTDEEVLLYSDYVFPRNTWLQAIELKSSDYTLLHHAGIACATPTFFVPEDLVLDSQDPDLKHFGDGSGKPGDMPGVGAEFIKQHFLYTWLPGQQIHARPAGEGFRILKGERFVLQAHIAPSIEAVPVKIRLGLRLVSGDVLSASEEYVAGMLDLRIPAGEAEHVERRIVEIDRKINVTGFNMHMHLRGSSAKILFHYPDGHSETALDIPNWDFNWQRVYYLSTPQVLPRDSKIEFIGVWNNSASNPRNPDPTVDAVYGGRTVDEMYTGNVYFSVPRIHPLRVEKGLPVGPATGAPGDEEK